MNSFYGHLKTILHHRHLVMKGCFRIGLYRQGICHDLSKFSPVEFGAGIRYFQGNRSPNAAEREDKGYSEAWMHHKGRNRHHFEYWTDLDITTGKYAPVKMPEKYLCEMVMDRIAASKTYLKQEYTDASPLEYFLSAKETKLLNEDSARLLEFLLTKLRDEGEDATFAFMKNVVLKGKPFSY